MAPKSSMFAWYEPNTSKAEKRLIFKLDAFVLLYTSMSFFIKYLEQTSVTNAYLSGMEHDLNLKGDELNWFTTYYNIGIIIGGPFTTLTLTYVSPRRWLPVCTAVSSLFVLFMYKAQDAKTIYGIRFSYALFSSSIMPGSYYLIGSWYRRSEIARRAALFTISSYIAVMVSGYLQTGLHSGMDGKLGLASWRWLFIFNAILGIPVVIFGSIFCPNEPNSPRIWWMTEEERAISIDRMEQEGRLPSTTLNWSIIKRVLKSWQFYCFPLAYGFKEFTCGTEMYRWMGLYMKWTSKHSTPHYSISAINSLPTLVPCSMIILTFLGGAAVDHLQRPGLVILFVSLFQIYGYAVFVVWPDNNAFKMSTYVIAGAFYSAIGPIINAWANSRCGGDNHLRALTTGFITTMGYICETIGQQVFFKVKSAPSFKKEHGYVWGLCWAIVAALWCFFVIPSVEKYYARRSMKAQTSSALSDGAFVESEGSGTYDVHVEQSKASSIH